MFSCVLLFEQYCDEDVECVCIQAGRVTGVSRDSDSDDDIPDELKAEFVDERTGEVPSQPK
jgi:hypothetical protein